MSPRNLRTSRAQRRLKVLVIAAISLLAPRLPGLAQTNPSPPGLSAPPPPPSGIPQAPVGHRQPRPSDLPAETRREESTNAPNRPATDLLPSICVKC